MNCPVKQGRRSAERQLNPGLSTLLLLETPRYHEPIIKARFGRPAGFDLNGSTIVSYGKEGAMLYRTYKYSQWDGTQRIFEFDADQLMDLLSDDILNHGDVMQALRDMMRQGL